LQIKDSGVKRTDQHLNFSLIDAPAPRGKTGVAEGLSQ
jgi:hypothetical protein